MEILSLIIGYIGTAVGIMAYQIKRRDLLLIFQIAGNLLPAISFLLLGPDKMIGGLVALIATCHTAIAYRSVKKGSVPSWSVTALFIALYAVGSFVPALLENTFHPFLDACPFLCGLFFSLALRANTVSLARVFYLFGSIPWLFYDCMGETVAVANLLTHIIALLSVVVSIIRYDILSKQRVDNIK